jgi:transcriptional regulator with XRE-family HTH domain
MTQTEFARVVGLSYAMLQQYEAGRKVSDTALDRLRSFATERGRPDLAMLFDPAAFHVRRVYEPAPSPASGPALDLHALLDEILASDDPTSRLAIENLLLITTQYLRRSQ